jgi:hypothetical protein
VQTTGEVSDDDAEKGGVSGPGAESSVETLAEGTRGGSPRVDGAGVVIGPGVRFRPIAQPLRGAAQAIEVRMTDDGVHWTDARDHVRGDHLGARTVLGFGRENEARVGAEALVHEVIVVVDPARETRPELLDEGPGNLLESAACRFGSERDVEHDDATLEVMGAR